MSSLSSNLDPGISTPLSTQNLAQFSLLNPDIEFSQSDSDTESYYSGSSVHFDIHPHLGTTYSWANQIEETEKLENPDEYNFMGYCPTTIGDKFDNGKYVILNKLRNGEDFTVWLAQDTLIDKEYVELKILTASATKTTNEQGVIDYLKSNNNPKHPGHKYIAFPIRWFNIESLNGIHLCVISEIIGYNLQMCKNYNRPNYNFPIHTTRAIIAQVALGLDYLHSLKICHGGILDLYI